MHVAELALLVEFLKVCEEAAVFHSYAYYIQREVCHTVHDVGVRHVDCRGCIYYDILVAVFIAELLYQFVKAVAQKQLCGIGRSYAGGNHVKIFGTCLGDNVVNAALVGKVRGETVAGAVHAQNLRNGVFADVGIYEYCLGSADIDNVGEVTRYETLAL